MKIKFKSLIIQLPKRDSNANEVMASYLAELESKSSSYQNSRSIWQ